jgi:APA family basic amino acid/polyamine antiporter
VWGFFYGWASLLVIMSGGIAAIAVGFGEYFGSFFPFFSASHAPFSVALGPLHWAPSGAQLAGSLAILLLTAINHLGAGPGVATQNALTALKLCAMGVFIALGYLLPAPVAAAPGSPHPELLAPALGLGMVAALWTYDGWYALTFSAGELENPARTLPLGLIAGTLAVTALYVAMNAVYLRALPAGTIAAGTRTAVHPRFRVPARCGCRARGPRSWRSAAATSSSSPG